MSENFGVSLGKIADGPDVVIDAAFYGPGYEGSTLMREYLTLVLEVQPGPDLTAALNARGAEGWRVVSAQPVPVMPSVADQIAAAGGAGARLGLFVVLERWKKAPGQCGAEATR